MTALRSSGLLLAAALLATFAEPAVAQQTSEEVADELVSDDRPEEVITDEGLKWQVGPSFSMSFNDNRSVVGQPDGWALTLDAHLPASIGYRTGPHEVRGDFDAQVAYSRTAALTEFVKSKDIFKLSSDYLFHAIEIFGPYARFSLETVMFEGYDVRPSQVYWSVSHQDGTVERYVGTRLLLTDPFQPLTIRESIGAFIQPYTTEPFAFEARAGFGGLHTLAEGQLVVSDDDSTSDIEVKELYSFDQAAVELGVVLQGSFVENKVTYKVGADVAFPVVNRPEDPNFTLAELINVDLNATLSFKMLSWLSLDYTFRALRRPQLVDAFQIQNNLLLTFSYTWSSDDTAEGE